MSHARPSLRAWLFAPLIRRIDRAEAAVFHRIALLQSDVQRQLTKLKESIMERFNEVLSRIDTATNGIAATLRDLRDELAGAGLSAEQEATVLATLNTAADKLEGIAADPADPVPAPEPEPEV